MKNNGSNTLNVDQRIYITLTDVQVGGEKYVNWSFSPDGCKYKTSGTGQKLKQYGPGTITYVLDTESQSKYVFTNTPVTFPNGQNDLVPQTPTSFSVSLYDNYNSPGEKNDFVLWVQDINAPTPPTITYPSPDPEVTNAVGLGTGRRPSRRRSSTEPD